MTWWIALAISALAQVQRPLTDVFISSKSKSEPDVINDGTAVAPWVSFEDHSDINVSSYQEFYIWGMSSRKVRLLSLSEDFSVLTVLISLTIPEPNDRSKIHVFQEIDLCTEPESFYLYFNCLSTGIANITVEVSDTSHGVSKFEFQKKCLKGGVRQDLQIFSGSSPIVVNGLVANNWTDGSLVLNGSETFSLSVSKGNQFLERVQVVSSLDVVAKGPVVYGGYLTPMPLDVIVVPKECKTDKIKLYLKMPPFDVLVLSWINKCEIEKYEEAPVIPVVTLAIFNETQSFTLVPNSTTIKSVSELQRSLAFTITADQVLPISRPILTFKHYLLLPELIFTADSISPSPTLFTLEFRCFNDGVSEVQVSFTLSNWHYEFSFEKACRKPRVYMTSESYFTSFGLALILGVTIIMAASFYVVLCRKSVMKPSVSFP